MDYRRRSARVLLVDGAERILLLRSYLDSRDLSRGCSWFTPGGRVHEGESLAEAAARELREETGLAVRPDELGRPTSGSAHRADAGWASSRARTSSACAVRSCS